MILAAGGSARPVPVPIMGVSHYPSDSHSPQEMSPDTMSPVYPDRPIRPLPKRRLRERLSSDVAESIKYPPAPPTTTPLFYYPYSINGTEDEARGGSYPVDRQRADEIERNYISRRNVDGDEVELSDEDIPEYPARGRYSRHSPDASGRSYRYVQKPESSKYPKPQAPASTTSSADGYDSFENTNNKKKRKIPTPGDASLNGIHLSSGFASLGISQAGDEALFRDDLTSGTGQTHLTGGAGAARGRIGRRTGRSPLRTLSDAPNHWPNGRGPKQRQSPNEGTGLISSAIANAEKHPVTPAKGQENPNLFQEQVTNKSSPASTQFTFTCDSQVPGTVAWPGPNPSLNEMGQAQGGRTTTTHGTQTSPKPPNPTGPLRQGSSQYGPNTPKQGGKTAPAKPRRRRTAGKEYLIAARQRRERQEYQNYHHPQAAEDIWMCEFCEYELIYGSPPEALIRQYEIKDRRIKKQEAERRRLLEKAKSKGRNKKKSSKASPKHAAPDRDRHTHQQSHQHATTNQNQSQGTQSEEYYEDEYEESYAEDDEPPMSPDTPAPALARQEELEAAYAKKRVGAARPAPQEIVT